VSSFDERIIAEFRENAGRVDTAGFGDRLILLHTTGARTGAQRVSPLMGLPTDSGWLVAASRGGAPEEPAWAHNLRAHPEVAVETGDGLVPAAADELRGDERDAGWARFLAAAPGFADYERRTTRTIAVFHLRRVDADS
jgi:deazaflavin-dependent oxidoreductase (nitroreductase family)